MNVVGIVVGVLMGTLFLVLLVVGALMYKRYRDKKLRLPSIEIELNVIDSTSVETRNSANLRATSFTSSVRPTSYSTNFSFLFPFFLFFLIVIFIIFLNLSTIGKSSFRVGVEDQAIKDPKNDTLLNTSLGFFNYLLSFLLIQWKKKKSEISIPGFLLLDFGSKIRKEEKLGSGGGGNVFSGVLLDQELISQHGTDRIALKQVSISSTLSDEDSKSVFLQEVSLMWYIFFNFFLCQFQIFNQNWFD